MVREGRSALLIRKAKRKFPSRFKSDSQIDRSLPVVTIGLDTTRLAQGSSPRVSDEANFPG